MKYQLIRHATAKLDFGGTCFLLDPWFAPKGKGLSYAGKVNSPLTGMPCKMWQAESRTDCIVLSHTHSDHFDSYAAEALDRDHPVICQPGDETCPLLAAFEDVRPMDSGLFNEVALERVNAQHGTSPEVLADMGPGSGWVFMAAEEPAVYWTGDTVWCEDVRRAIETFRPGVIIVHAGAAQWNGEAITMDAAGVIETCKAAPEATVIAVHLEAADHGTLTRKALREAAEAAGISGQQLRIPADGEEIVILQDTAF